MSRVPSGKFADFFPSAPREAKIKAKARERAKTKPSDSSSWQQSRGAGDSLSAPRSRDEAGQPNISATAQSSARPQHERTTNGTEETDIQGDLLNCVRSASSHASTASSVFSATAPSSRPAAMSHPYTLTPLTNDELSPNGQIASPRHAKSTLNTVSVADHLETSSPAHVPEQAPVISEKWDGQRATARDRNSFKGKTFEVAIPTDPKKQPRLDKGTYKEIPWVRSIMSAGSVIIGVH